MKNKHILLNLFFLIAIALTLTTQINAAPASMRVTGVVVDGITNAPLLNVNITIAGTTIGAVSDRNGHFQIENLSAGQYRLQASMMGYKSASRTITIRGESTITLKFSLQPTVLVMDSVSVVGRKIRDLAAMPNLESSGLELSTATVTRHEIKRQGAKTLMDAIKFVPGAMVETRGRKVKQFFSVRGQRYPYPEFAINHAWQREFHELPYFFSAADIEKIEVIRSSAALLTGLSGMSGVINITTRTYDTPETSGEIETGSFGSRRAHLSHGATKGKISYATGIGFQHTDGPDDRHAAESISNFYGNLNWRPTAKLTLKFNLFHLNGKRELALAEPPASSRFQNETSSYDPYRATLSNLIAFYRPSAQMSTKMQVYYSDRNPTYLLEDYKTHVLTRTSERDFEWGLNLLQSVSLSKNNVLRFGGLYNHWLAPNGKRFYVGKRCDLTTYSAVIVDEHQFGNLNLDAGIRWAKTYIDEYGAFNINGTAGAFKKVDPVLDEWEPATLQGSFGATYNLPANLSVHAHFAAGEIQPRRGTLDVNLQEPKNETRLKMDLGVRSIIDEIGRVSLVAFVTRQNDALVLSGKTEEMDNRVMELYLNRDQNQLGVEFEARLARLFNTAEAFLNITAMSSKAEIDGSMLDNKEIPDMISNIGIYAQRSGFDLTLLGKHMSKFESARFVAGVNGQPAVPQPLGDFFALDVTAGWTIGGSHNARLYFEFSNITDEKYSTVVGYPDFGRRMILGMQFHMK